MLALVGSFGERRPRARYQACPQPQCGQFTVVETAALKR